MIKEIIMQFIAFYGYLPGGILPGFMMAYLMASFQEISNWSPLLGGSRPFADFITKAALSS